GEAGCNVDVGAGVDQDGRPYVYNPQEPEKKHYGGEVVSTDATVQAKLQEFANFLGIIRIRHYEYTSEDIFGITRFLPARSVLGEAWPGGPNTVSAPTRSGLVRGGDKLGNGGFLAVRWDDRANNLRFHGGIDYVATPGENIYSPITGEVIRIKNPGHDLNGILIRAQNGYTASVYYINVDQSIIGRIAYSHAPVEAGKTLIGTAQD